VGSKPVDVAADPKTNTIYVASGLGDNVLVISRRCAI
jgi:DNA-binding beta-propeller fold protein YncE